MGLLLSVLNEVCATIFTATNIKITNDRVGLSRSAIFLVIFVIIHAGGNLHVSKGPDDFDGCGNFYDRLYWTGFGLPANIVEEYILLSIVLHVLVSLKRTWDMKLALVKSSGLSVLNLAISGLMLMTFMAIHLLQFRFGDTDQFGPYLIKPPGFLINFQGILTLNIPIQIHSLVLQATYIDIFGFKITTLIQPLLRLMGRAGALQ